VLEQLAPRTLVQPPPLLALIAADAAARGALSNRERQRLKLLRLKPSRWQNASTVSPAPSKRLNNSRQTRSSNRRRVLPCLLAMLLPASMSNAPRSVWMRALFVPTGW